MPASSSAVRIARHASAFSLGASCFANSVSPMPTMAVASLSMPAYCTAMNFDFSPEELAFQREVEAFLAANASPDVMDANPEQLSQTVDTPPKRAFMRKLAERGWLGMSWPKEYGGQEKSGIYDFILTEALSRWGAPQPGKGVGIVGKTIIRNGNDRLKAYFLPRIIRGEIEFAIGYSEPQAGSDAANMQLRAQKIDGGWKLDGRKIWTTSAHFADWYWVGARTDAHKHKGITLFLVEMKHPGLTIHPTWTIGDERTNEVFFDDVFVSDDFVVGEVNHGWTYICEALDLERFAMMPVGPLEKKVEALTGWVRAATRDGEPYAQRPARAAHGRAGGHAARGVAHAAAARDQRGAQGQRADRAVVAVQAVHERDGPARRQRRARPDRRRRAAEAGQSRRADRRALRALVPLHRGRHDRRRHVRDPEEHHRAPRSRAAVELLALARDAEREPAREPDPVADRRGRRDDHGVHEHAAPHVHAGQEREHHRDRDDHGAGAHDRGQGAARAQRDRQHRHERAHEIARAHERRRRVGRFRSPARG
jgi:alkylation response protein AidB-like acyl-CoA dehydrogenase